MSEGVGARVARAGLWLGPAAFVLVLVLPAPAGIWMNLAAMAAITILGTWFL